MNSELPFWQSKTLAEMNRAEWESLCDGCGKCCLHKLQDEYTEDVFYTRVACELLDIDSCRCTDYPHRQARIPDCVDIRRLPESDFYWLPATCAYRLISEDKDLPDWHHLKSGDANTVHQAICTVRGRGIAESMADMDELETEIIHWVDD